MGRAAMPKAAIDEENRLFLPIYKIRISKSISWMILETL
jgi:hypothetical protein